MNYFLKDKDILEKKGLVVYCYLVGRKVRRLELKFLYLGFEYDLSIVI